jgi:hypothetical protein
VNRPPIEPISPRPVFLVSAISGGAPCGSFGWLLGESLQAAVEGAVAGMFWGCFLALPISLPWLHWAEARRRKARAERHEQAE